MVYYNIKENMKNKGTKNKLILTFIAVSLLTSCGAFNNGLALNEDVNITYRRTSDLEENTLSKLRYDENWFYADSYTYNEDLAELSLALDMAATDYDKYDVTGKTGNKNVKEAYLNLGFDSDSFYSVGYDKKDDNSIGLSIASKNMIKNGSEEFTLLSIDMRSKGYGSGGWLGNVSVGEGKENTENIDNKDYHVGFYTAGQFVLNEIKTYVEKENIDLNKTKIWLVGFSRGAAVCNLTSIFLGDLMDRKNIYTYAAATPAYKVNVTNDETLKNIFNLINTGDIVPMVPPSSWNFGIEGTTVNLPTINNNNRKSFQAEFYNLTGVEYTGSNDYQNNSKNIINMFTKYASTREEYALVFEPSIKSLFDRNEDGTVNYSYIDNILSCEGTNADAVTSSTIIEFIKNTDSTDFDKILGLAANIISTLETGKEYWATKDSYNDELLGKIIDIINDAIKLYAGGGTDEEKVAFNTLKEALNLGIESPLLEQHWEELYLSKFHLNS
jgi:hypothetical protein